MEELDSIEVGKVRSISVETQDLSVDLKGRVVVITGASRGIGRALMQSFLAHGARVVATSRAWAGLGDFREELNRRPDVLTVELDLRNEAQIEASYQATIDRFGTVDVLINNASMRQRDLFPPMGRTTILETTAANWGDMFAVNVLGGLRVTRQFIKPMIAQGRGSIVHVSSTGVVSNAAGAGIWTALRPNSREQPYMASKAALTNLALYLADEVQRFNVAVNVVMPGGTRTTGWEEQEALRRAQGAPGRISLQPEHVAPIMLHLARQDASGETGRLFDAVRWNEEHGYGGAEAWTVK
jgi:NAD(P)-dependent dehydrogenase (short-subunit alcohol dehydrogenase family)